MTLPESVVPHGSARSPEPTRRTVLAARDVVKSFPTRDGESVVLDHVSIDVADGDFLTIVGPSGCGKTTMLQLLAGLQMVTSGAVQFSGTAIESPPPGVVYVFQQFAKSIFPWRTVLDNVVFGLEHDRGTIANGGSRSGGRCWIVSASPPSSGITRPSCPAGCSSGWPSRGHSRPSAGPAHGRAFSALDALTRAKLQKLVLDLWRSLGITVVFVTHDIEEALLLSTRVIALHKSPANIDIDLRVNFSHPRNPVTLGEDRRYLAMRRQLLGSIYRQEGLSYEDGPR